jgi:CheY-like chemotaxis protein
VTDPQSTAVTVLVADDHPLWRDAVTRDLEQAGYRVVATAATGAEAVRRAAATRPDGHSRRQPELPGAGAVGQR